MKPIKDKYKKVCDKHFGVEMLYDTSIHGWVCPLCELMSLVENGLTNDQKEDYEDEIRSLNMEIEDYENENYNLQEELNEANIKIRELELKNEE